MSEFGPNFEDRESDKAGDPNRFLRKISPEAAKYADEFDLYRHQLYDWLSLLAVDLPELWRVERQTKAGMYSVTDKFSESASAIIENVSHLPAVTHFISKSWATDNRERVTLFKQLMPDVLFMAQKEENVQSTVDTLLRSGADNQTVLQSLHKEYHHALSTDVGWFFTGVMLKRQAVPGPQLLVTPTGEAIDQFEPSLSFLKTLSRQYGNWVLRTL